MELIIILFLNIMNLLLIWVILKLLKFIFIDYQTKENALNQQNHY